MVFSTIPRVAPYPDATNTGPQAGTTFTPSSGDLNSSVAGQVIEAREVTGQIIIRHPNVTVRDCIVHCTEFAGISTVGANLSGCKIQRTRVIGIQNTVGISPDALTAGEISQCDISNVENGIFVGADSQYFHDNYIHDLSSLAGDPHIDGIQGSGGFTSLRIEHNTIISWDTSCIILQNEGGGFSGAVINDNRLIIDQVKGGAYGILLQEKPGSPGPVSNITVTNNRILKGTGGGQVYAYFHNVNGLRWSGNVDDGSGVSIMFDDGGGNTLIVDPPPSQSGFASYVGVGTNEARRRKRKRTQIEMDMDLDDEELERLLQSLSSPAAI